MGIIIFAPKLWKFFCNQPEADQRQELLHFIYAMKKEGLGFKARRDKLEKRGLQRDVAEMLLAEAEMQFGNSLEDPTKRSKNG